MCAEIVDFCAGGRGKGDLASEMKNAGFQASRLAEGTELLGEMLRDEKCTVFFGFTANLVASGVRGLVAELCEKKKVDAVVTTAGSIDHDIIKSFMPYEMGTFAADDADLHRRGINRIGNIFVPNKGFEILEGKVQGWLAEIYGQNKITNPSNLANFFGSKLKKGSFLSACAENKIPVFCPGITDGAIGLQMYFFRQENPDFVCDVTGDMKKLADLVLNAERAGAIILGGGISKHHIIGANILREGLDYAVYVTTAQEFDGSLSGAETGEAKSWGKIKEKGKSVTVNCDATIAFPLMMHGLKQGGVL